MTRAQCLLTLLDSPLNKAGKLQVYIHTSTNVLIEVNPRTRIPRTYKRFAPLMSASSPPYIPVHDGHFVHVLQPQTHAAC